MQGIGNWGGPKSQVPGPTTQQAEEKVEGVQGAWWMPEGVKGRRRTWLAARSGGELLASVEPPMSEWGNPVRVMPDYPPKAEGHLAAGAAVNPAHSTRGRYHK